MNDETPSRPDNMPLRSMIIFGVASAVIGCIVWLANNGSEASSYNGAAGPASPTGQAVGSVFLSFGLLLLALAWTAAAVARAIQIEKH